MCYRLSLTAVSRHIGPDLSAELRNTNRDVLPLPEHCKSSSHTLCVKFLSQLTPHHPAHCRYRYNSARVRHYTTWACTVQRPTAAVLVARAWCAPPSRPVASPSRPDASVSSVRCGGEVRCARCAADKLPAPRSVAPPAAGMCR